ncbi:hypothetical protein BDW22DRAFT_119281 [Trametopsis cervina]|nr:hypothetical protein BDW22DRAFT_119281 [Trametopsis cervina]
MSLHTTGKLQAALLCYGNSYLQRRRLAALAGPLKRLSSTQRLLSDAKGDEKLALSDPSSVKQKTRTKKKLIELPTSLLGGEGLLVSPLDPWNGGLPVPAVAILDDQSVPPKLKSKPRKTSKDADISTVKKPRGTRRILEESASPPVAGGSNLQQPSTPLAKDILDNLSRFSHCILLTRVGQFYESYFDQAAEVSKLLNIKLTSKTWGGQRVPMAGFPVANLHKYLKVLVQDHRCFVAICEEFMRDRKLGPKGGFDRRVSRIVTPGTLIDEPFINPYENNYLLSVYAVPTGPTASSPEDASDTELGLAWMDVSTGDFFAKHITWGCLQDELTRINPKEIVLDERPGDELSQRLRQDMIAEGYFVSSIALPAAGLTEKHEIASDPETDDLTSLISPEISSSLTLSPSEKGAVRVLTAYLSANLLEGIPTLLSPSREGLASRMQIDGHTIKALELKESMREGGTKGSLLSAIKRTTTSGGTRLLSRWICSPSASVQEITARQSLVAFLHSRPHLRADLAKSLSHLEDATRVLQKLLHNKGATADLVAICTTIDGWNSIKSRLEIEKNMELRERGLINQDEWSSVDAVSNKLDGLRDLASRIRNAVLVENLRDDELGEESNNAEIPSLYLPIWKGAASSYAWSIQPRSSPKLAKLHKQLQASVEAKDVLEKQLQMVYSAPSLTLRASPGQGMHVHIGRAKRDSSRIKADDQFIPLSTGTSIRTFFYVKWSQLGNRMVELTGEIQDAERAAFELLRADVSAHAAEIRKNSRIIDELDVAVAYANLAEELNLVRPTITDDTSYDVVNGRHPTVELGLLDTGRAFNPNTVSFTAESSLHLITGPNMAGKSTLLRQTALIAILAQTGSFVPADSATIGVIDKIFSRVGAKDDLFRNRSTFMVEMLETADILRRATPKSLVIMDEVGRGTTMEDGLAIAFATVHHLLSQTRCRTLFATHFHEIADLLGYTDTHKGQGSFSRVSFFCTDVEDTLDGYFTYSHRLRPGVNRDSHGLKVAQLAGMPESTLTIASGVRKWLRERRNTVTAADQSALQALGSSLAIGSVA